MWSSDQRDSAREGSAARGDTESWGGAGLPYAHRAAAAGERSVPAWGRSSPGSDHTGPQGDVDRTNPAPVQSRHLPCLSNSSSSPLPHNFCPYAPASARLLPREAATPHAPLSLLTGGLGDSSHRVVKGMPDSVHRAGFRAWPPPAMPPNRALHNVLPHNLRIEAMTLKSFQISRPCGRLS
jgi:hypothetical protein